MLENEDRCRFSEVTLSTLLQSRDWAQLRDGAQDLLAESGMSDFLMRMDITAGGAKQASNLFGSLPTPLIDFFRAVGREPSDPVNRHFAKSIRPTSWQVEQFCQIKSGQTYLRLKKYGIGHGISVVIRSRRAVSRVDFFGKSPEFSPSLTSRHADAHLLGAYLHEVAESLWDKGTTERVTCLTARELECLSWSAGGKTSSEIGAILGISQHTAYFHLKNAATKLNVFGTRHAVTQAVMLGIIKPNR